MTPTKDVTLSKSISKKISELRLKMFPNRGGQVACAKKFGIKPQMWNGWEGGRNIPSDENQRKLADFFGISLAELRGETQNASHPGAASEPLPAMPNLLVKELEATKKSLQHEIDRIDRLLERLR